VVLDFNGQSVGEFTAKVNRNWSLISPTVAGGGKSTITIPKKVAERDWMKLGNFVYIEQDPLPPWIGMIDTPWNAKSPVQINVYNAEYILSQRYLDNPTTITGTPFFIIDQLVAIANAQEETYIRTQNQYTGHTGGVWAAVFDQKDIWSQLKNFVQKNGVEVYFSTAHRIWDRQLIINLIVAEAAGQATGYEFRDGQGGNMRVTAASLEGTIQNRLVGINKASTDAERIILPAVFDNNSVRQYRMRGGVYQFDVTNESQLLNQINIQMATTAYPRVKLTIDVKNVGDALSYCQLGNSAWVHASNVLLPGGQKGWRGTARIIVMAWNESSNTMSLALEAKL
jgi:hypothetical protein